MKADVQAYSMKTGITYPNWEALVAAEADGWVVTAVMCQYSSGEFFTFSVKADSQKQARNKAAAIRRKHRRERPGNDLVVVTVRPLWKDIP